MDCSTNPKAYWSLLKTFLPCIPPLFHNIKFISNFSDNAELFSNFFAEQYTLSSNVSEIHVRLNIKSANKLNNDLTKISTWAFQWKMNFNPDPTKQAQEVIFSRKLQNTNHPSLNCNHNTESHKYHGMVLDSRLDFKEHMEIIFKKNSKTIGLLRKLQNLLPKNSLITVCKPFIRPHMEYGDIAYNVYNAYGL